jgi:hypothetical protein
MDVAPSIVPVVGRGLCSPRFILPSRARDSSMPNANASRSDRSNQ